MTRCVLCHEERETLTDEHVVFAALGVNEVVKKATCHECQTRCNRAFEQKFLKGSNFVSMLRALVGIKGRRNTPIYGFDDHGEPITIEVQPGFPPIRVGLTARGFERPMQIVFVNSSRQALDYVFLPNDLQLPITTACFDEQIDKIPEGAVTAALWADGNFIAVNHWRDLLETFVVWCNRKELSALVSCISTATAQIPFSLDWNHAYIKRALGKIGFMYLIQHLHGDDRYASCLDEFRGYLLNGTLPKLDGHIEEPVNQWSALHPLQGLPDENFTYLVAVANIQEASIAFVQLHNMGLFYCRLARRPNFSRFESFATNYLLKKTAEDKFAVEAKQMTNDAVERFTRAAQGLS